VTRSPKVKQVAVLAATVAVCTVAAAWRWPDSAHAMGVIRSADAAGRPRGRGPGHPVALPAGPERYQLVVTAPVLAPWRGDARIALEGEPAVDWSVELTHPIVDLGLRRWPRLEGKVLRDLAPGDRLALWVDVAAPAVDPVCGMVCAPGIVEGRRCFCSEGCRSAFRANPGPARGPGVTYRLVVRDEQTGSPLLTIPVRLGGEGGGHAGAHH
jgi:hypothetical protein